MSEGHVYLIFRVPTEKELGQIRSAQGAGATVYSKMKLSISTKGLPEELTRDSVNRLFERVRGFAHDVEFKHGNPIRSTAYREFYPYFISRIPTFRKASELAVQLAVIEHVAKNYDGVKITVLTDLEPLKSAHNIEVWYSRKHKISNSIWGPLKYGLIFLLRAFLGFVQSIATPRNRFVIGYSEPDLVPMIDLQGKMVKGDPIFGYLVGAASKRKEFSILSVQKNYNSEVDFSWRRMLLDESAKGFVFFEWYIFLALLNPFTLGRIVAYRQHLNKSSLQPLSELSLLDQTIVRYFNSERTQMLQMACRYEAAKLFCKIKTPKGLACGNEHSYTKFPMMQACKKFGVKTFGLQHGGISHHNLYYSFDERDRSFDPITNFFFAWGDYIRNRLVERSIYPKDSIRVLGQSRTDVIARLNHRREIDHPFTILFTTQLPPNKLEVVNNMLHDVYRFRAKHPDFRVWIKPHPREYSDLNRFRGIAEKEGVKANIVTDDLYYLLSKSDVAITYFSTTGAEAIYFDKPLIVFDYDKEDIAGYHRDGVAELCSNYEELESVLLSMKARKNEDLSQARAEFRSKRLFKIDGKRTDDILNNLLELSK